jgi:putative inorganic carbon (hco3(-)) transporter
VLERTKIRWVYFISLAFILLNAYLMIRDMYWALLIPAGLIILFLYVRSLEKILFLITFCTPIAINIRNLDFGVGLSLPTEPLMAGVLVLFFIKLIYENSWDLKILKHPVSVVILLQLAWMLITSITSQMPVVSFKFLISRLWFLVPFYFIGAVLFRKTKNIHIFIWMYVIPLLGVIGYTTYNHYLYGFEEQAGHWVMEPFFNDHTAYGAILTLFIPIFVGFSFSRTQSKLVRFFSFVTLVILLVALVLSFSRAAWVSLAAALMIYIVILLRIKMKWILLTLAFLAGVFFLFQNEIWDKLEKNKQGSSANFVEHMQSISNVTTDDSNLERINRWESAFRMFSERPVFGFGPGTYQFEYAPYQRSSEKTRISTNAGDKGNAHSEYIGPLAESGVLGMLCVVALMIFTIYTGLRVYRKTDSKEIKMLSLAITLGLITYFFHGTMNDFLDTDKASVPFWGFIAVLVAMDMFLPKNGKEVSGKQPDA